MAVTVSATLTYTYLPTPATPVGFEATFKAYDTTAGGSGGQTFATVIQFDPTNAVCWTTSADTSTGRIDPTTSTYIRWPAHVYDPTAIRATWTERISNNAAAPTIYVLRGKFNATSGLIQIQAECTQLTDPSNSASLAPTNVTSLSLPIPAITYP